MSTGHHEASWRLPESDPFANTDVEHYQRAGPDRRARQARLGLLRRLPGAVQRRRPAPGRHAGADRAADRARRRDRAHRADRDRVDDLQRAVQPGPPVRLARPRQRRPGGLEHRHHGRRRTRRATSTSTTSRRTRERYERAAEFLEVAYKLWDSWEDDARARATRSAGVWARRRPGPADRPRRAALPGARPAERAALAAGPPAARAGRLVRGRQGASPPGTPRRSSPRSRRSTTRRRSTRTSSSGRRALGRDPDDDQDPAGHRARCIGATEAEALRAGAGAGRADPARVRAAAAGQDAAGRPGGPAARPAAAGRPARRGRDRGRQEPLHADRRRWPGGRS